jgi:hypothetical protein
MALLLLAAAGRPRASLAQQLGRIPRIAVLMPYREGDPLIADLRTAFERALSDLGWIDDRNIEIEYASQAAILTGCTAWRMTWSSAIPT